MNKDGNNRLKLFIFFGLAIFMISCSSSRRSAGAQYGWDLLGTQKVDFVREKDEIVLQGNNRYTAIRFRVEDRDVHISGLAIYFQNGDKLEPAIDDNIGANQDSRIIEINSDGRIINRIEFKYRTVGSILKGRAKVLVYGKRYDYDNR